MNRVAAIVVRGLEGWTVKSPHPGWFSPAIANGELVSGGRVIGELEVLGRHLHLIVDESIEGRAKIDATPRAVGYGDILLAVVAIAYVAVPGAPAHDAAPIETRGLVFRAPTSGRFYLRASPDKPPYVAVGVELAPGATVCLLEVMKTFNRVTYGGAGLPARARVTELLVADGADVNAGDALVALEAI